MSSRSECDRRRTKIYRFCRFGTSEATALTQILFETEFETERHSNIRLTVRYQLSTALINLDHTW